MEENLSELEKKISLKEKEIYNLSNIHEKEKKTRFKQKNELKEIILVVSDFLVKPEKHKLFYDEIRV